MKLLFRISKRELNSNVIAKRHYVIPAQAGIRIKNKQSKTDPRIREDDVSVTKGV